MPHYKDTPKNRRLGRVGKEYGKGSKSEQVWLLLKYMKVFTGFSESECVTEILGVYGSKEDALEEQEKYGGIIIKREVGKTVEKPLHKSAFEQLG